MCPVGRPAHLSALAGRSSEVSSLVVQTRILREARIAAPPEKGGRKRHGHQHEPSVCWVR